MRATTLLGTRYDHARPCSPDVSDIVRALRIQRNAAAAAASRLDEENKSLRKQLTECEAEHDDARGDAIEQCYTLNGALTQLDDAEREIERLETELAEARRIDTESSTVS